MSYSHGDKVIIHSTTDLQLDGQLCVVVGRVEIHPECTFYIIRLEHTVVSSDGFINSAISLTEHCLKPY